MKFKLPDHIRYVVIGDPIGHSLSPVMQNTAFGREVYGKMSVAAADLPEFCEWAKQRLDGFNVTIPHKEAVYALVDRLDRSAVIAGGVNTVKVEDGLLTGYSTDGYGLEMALQDNFAWQSGSSGGVLFVGAGGAAKSIAGRLAADGVTAFYIANRTLARAEALAQTVRNINPGAEVFCAEKPEQFVSKANVILQCTSLGLHEDDAPPFDFTSMDGKAAVFDLVYNRETKLGRYCREHGIRFADGRDMLVYQGAKAFEIWTGKMPDTGAMKACLNRELAVK